jgi:D-aminopeptidase
MTTPARRLDRMLERLPRAYPGPGGAVAVLSAGAVLVRHAWGWANAERRIPFTPRTLFRVCSITKQFTCALLLDAFPDPSVLDGDVRARLPALTQPPPGARDLCHNQSGLRDYWALAMLHGAAAEAPFGDAEAARVIGASRTLQFAPGSRYSYCNQNFRLLSDILQDRAGRDFADLLRQRVLAPAGMERALLAADTTALPDGTQGYEGSSATGFRPAENRVLWTGDAGLAASLDDMIAWERQVDATRADPGALYQRLAAPQHFADGAPARYGFGLSHASELRRALTGHGGALRGWRSHRLHDAAARLSVVVLFNHMADARQAALDLLGAALDCQPAAPDARLPPPDWLGSHAEPETGLAVRIEAAAPGQVRLRFGQAGETLDLRADGSAGGGATVLRPGPGGLWMHRPQDNQGTLLRPCAGTPAADFAGRYRCAELDAALDIVDAGGVLYGAPSGFLGQGRMEMLEPVGPDLWLLPCPRALDHTPPGDWTLAVRREAGGRVAKLTVGCWLARRLAYQPC